MGVLIRMATSSGNSLGSSHQNSGSEGSPAELQLLMDQRKRKRMLSNRESARRSRMRKQKHLDDLMAQATQLRKENNQILTSLNVTTQQFLNVESENSVLRAQMMELTHRLQSLDDIINYMNSNNATANAVFEIETLEQQSNPADNFLNNPWNLMYLNQQPIMASAHDMFQY